MIRSTCDEQKQLDSTFLSLFLLQRVIQRRWKKARSPKMIENAISIEELLVHNFWITSTSFFSLHDESNRHCRSLTKNSNNHNCLNIIYEYYISYNRLNIVADCNCISSCLAIEHHNKIWNGNNYKENCNGISSSCIVERVEITIIRLNAIHIWEPDQLIKIYEYEIENACLGIRDSIMISVIKVCEWGKKRERERWGGGGEHFNCYIKKGSSSRKEGRKKKRRGVGESN